MYGAGGQLFGEYDASGTMIREYVYLGGNPLVQIDGGTSEVLTYLHSDHIGTPRIGMDSTGAQVWAWSSAGNGYGQNAPTGTATVNLRFAGQYFDGESDLHYNWNRYYDPATGRYISSDPIGLGGGLNTFAYAGANPVMFTDPEGLRKEWWDDPEVWSKGLTEGCNPGMVGCENSRVNGEALTRCKLVCFGTTMTCGIVDGPFPFADFICSACLSLGCVKNLMIFYFHRM